MDTEMLIDKYQLNDSEAAVLRFMDKNRDCLKSLGIREVAKASYVSTTAIINMAKKSVILVIVSWSLPMETNIHQLAFLRISQTKKKMNLSDYYLAIEKNGLWF